DGVTLQGVDIDVGAAIAAALKTNLQFSNVATFAGLIPGIQSGRYPFAMASITDRKDREEKVDFVNYVNVGLGILVAAGNPKKIAGLEDLCGTTVAIPTGSVAGDVMANQSKKCIEAGKGAITINTFPGQDQAQLQLRTGRADANINDYPVVVYNAKESGGTLEATAANFCTAPFGIATMKNEPELVAALKTGLETAIQNGEYAKILKKWGLESIALRTVTVNGAITQEVDPVCLPSQ
ncbi:ABC transporter substrate-binding protein, partial [Mesorhizobium sp. P5_C1]